MDVRLSDAEKVFIIHGVQEGLRNDGRRLASLSVLLSGQMYDTIAVSSSDQIIFLAWAVNWQVVEIR